MIGPSQHAVDALTLFYPEATGFDVIDEVQRGVPIEPGEAVGLVGRKFARDGSRYVLHRERTGIFVLDETDLIVTFLRFYGRKQYETAARLWPGGDPPTAAARWNRPEGVLPNAPTEKVQISEGACKATGLNRDQLRQAVIVALHHGEAQPPDGYAAGHPLTGVIRVGAVVLGLCAEEQRIRVVAAQVSREARLARKKRERHLAGLRQAAELLRANGWTCTPPAGWEEGR